MGFWLPPLQLFPGQVSLGDIEPCLCGAFIYAKQVG